MRTRLLEDGGRRETLLGYLGEEPVGVLQLDAASGWISLLGIRPDCRRRGFGVQLIGQAVQQTRAAGGGKIFAALPENGEARSFLEEYGFHPATDGAFVEKNIAFLPEFLGR